MFFALSGEQAIQTKYVNAPLKIWEWVAKTPNLSEHFIADLLSAMNLSVNQPVLGPFFDCAFLQLQFAN